MLTSQDVVDVLNALGINKAQFAVMMQMFVAQVGVAQARGALAAAQAAQEQMAAQAAAAVQEAQNAVLAAEETLRELVEAAVK